VTLDTHWILTKLKVVATVEPHGNRKQRIPFNSTQEAMGTRVFGWTMSSLETVNGVRRGIRNWLRSQFGYIGKLIRQYIIILSDKGYILSP